MTPGSRRSRVAANLTASSETELVQARQVFRFQPPEDFAETDFRREGHVECRPGLLWRELVGPAVVASRESQRPTVIGRCVNAPMDAPDMAFPRNERLMSELLPGIPPSRSWHRADGLQEGAGVQCFEVSLHAVQPSDSDRFGWRDTTHVAARAVEPAAGRIRSLERLLNPLHDIDQSSQALPHSLLGIRRSGPPPLQRASAGPQGLSKLVFR